MSKLPPPFSNPYFYPLMVWCQDPKLASLYKKMGINTFFSLWQGPTEEQLAQLQEHDMYAICHQNEVGLAHIDDPLIIAWMHGDEPDNKHPARNDGPVPVDQVLSGYIKMKERDMNRPVVVNLGQGVANDEFPGRGIDLDQYPEYVKGADIVSYDVYPVANIKIPGGWKPDGENYLWYVAKGIDRLRQWTGQQKPVWNCIECTQVSNPPAKATPEQISSEVWMSIIHGSTGICWFVHEFKPVQNDARLLADDEMKQAVSDINHEIIKLAPVINSPTVTDKVTVKRSDPEVPVDIMVKEYEDNLYIFAVCMRNKKAIAEFTISGLNSPAKINVTGQTRTIAVQKGKFTDDFRPYGVNIYTLPLRSKP